MVRRLIITKPKPESVICGRKEGAKLASVIHRLAQVRTLIYSIGPTHATPRISDEQVRRLGNASRHGHGKPVDGDIGVERLEDVLGHQRSINSRILVLFELWQLLRSDVDHVSRPIDCPLAAVH